jgi:hypothetical protein
LQAQISETLSIEKIGMEGYEPYEGELCI